MKSRTKKGLIVLITLLIVAVAFVAIRSYVLSRIKITLREKLETLNKTDFNVHYDSIYVEWRRNVIVVEKLVIEKNAYDTTCLHPEFLSIRKVSISGFNLPRLLLKRELSIRDVLLDHPHIVIREHSRFLSGGDSTQKNENEFALLIGRLRLLSARIEYTDTVNCKLKNELISTLEATGLHLEFKPGEPFDFALSTLRLDSTDLLLPESFYTLNIQKIGFNSSTGDLQLDTLKIIPHYSKLEFGRNKGFDIDRIEGVIPFIKLSKFAYQHRDTFSIQAEKASIQMYLRVFHDKRLPHENVVKPLPVALLRTLPFGLRIDTLELAKSYVLYEEFAPEAEEPGNIFFDNLIASIANISNDPHLTDGQTTMNAQADFMGHGKLTLQTVFPWKKDRECQIEGSLKSFPFPKVNSMLKPSTPVEIESGMLDDLDFRFTYNELQSQGSVMLNYHDLKVVLNRQVQEEEKKEEKADKRKHKKKDQPEHKKDNLKTFIINSFLIRKDMDEDLPEEKRTGQVNFQRDKTRSIFNYWWKSLFSGLKSAFHLDKVKQKPKNEKRKKNK